MSLSLIFVGVISPANHGGGRSEHRTVQSRSCIALSPPAKKRYTLSPSPPSSSHSTTDTIQINFSKPCTSVIQAASYLLAQQGQLHCVIALSCLVYFLSSLLKDTPSVFVVFSRNQSNLIHTTVASGFCHTFSFNKRTEEQPCLPFLRLL